MLAGMGTHSLLTQISDAAGFDMAVAPQSIPNPSWPDWARSPSDDNPASQPTAAAMLPDPAVCRARAAGFGGYADCLVKHPFQCPHALSFGYGTLCRSPKQDEIVLRTAAQDHAGVSIA